MWYHMVPLGGNGLSEDQSFKRVKLYLFNSSFRYISPIKTQILYDLRINE